MKEFNNEQPVNQLIIIFSLKKGVIYENLMRKGTKRRSREDVWYTR